MKKKEPSEQTREVIETDETTEYIYTPTVPRAFDQSKLMRFAGSVVGRIILLSIIVIGFYLLAVSW